MTPGRIFLTVEGNDVIAKYNPTPSVELTHIICNLSTLDGLIEYCATNWGIGFDDVIVLCSSSLDFPTDYTSDRDTIALCNQIRGV